MGAVPLETRGLVAEFDEGRGLLTMWGPTKMTHTNWRILSNLIGLPQSCIHFIEPEVGGASGARAEFRARALARYCRAPAQLGSGGYQKTQFDSPRRNALRSRQAPVSLYGLRHRRFSRPVRTRAGAHRL